VLKKCGILSLAVSFLLYVSSGAVWLSSIISINTSVKWAHEPSQNNVNKYSFNTAFHYFGLHVYTNSANEFIVKFLHFAVVYQNILYYSVQNTMIAISVAADIVTVCVGFICL